MYVEVKKVNILKESFFSSEKFYCQHEKYGAKRETAHVKTTQQHFWYNAFIPNKTNIQSIL
jgi:hypothetical protein